MTAAIPPTRHAAAQPAPPAPPAPVRIVATARGAVELALLGDAGPAVLALHGAMGGHDQGVLLARVLGEPGYRHVAPSRPGYLGTPFAGDRSAAEQADRYAALLDALRIDRAAAMAVSGGGPSAIHFALRHPDRCWALVLVSTVADRGGQQPPLRFRVMGRLMGWLARIPAVAAAMERGATRDPEAGARRSVRDPRALARLTADAEAWALFRELQASTARRVPERMAGTWNDVEVARTVTYDLARVATPTLVLHGTADPLARFADNGAILAARIPGAELVALEGGEHAAIFTHRAQARAAVTAFLRRHAPSPGV